MVTYNVILIPQTSAAPNGGWGSGSGKKVKVGPAAAPTLSLMDLLQFFTGLTRAVPALHSF